jgi:phosphoglycolate phosphatase
MLVRRALGDPEDETYVQRALDFFLTYYRQHKLDHTHVYDGVLDTLRRLQNGLDGQMRRMAVLSNKPVHPTRAIVDALGMKDFFFAVYGGNSFPTKKPDPMGARQLLLEAKCRPEHAVIVGDSSNDILTGRNAGIWTVGVTYGFAPQTLDLTPPDVLIDTPTELVQAFAENPKSAKAAP